MKGELSADATVVATQDQVSTKLGQEETSILSLDKGVYYGLNEVGTRVWELIREPKTVRQLNETLANEYDVDPKRLEAELQKLLEQLAHEGLVVIRSEAREGAAPASASA